jgi:hypothetical protein
MKTLHVAIIHDSSCDPELYATLHDSPAVAPGEEWGITGGSSTGRVVGVWSVQLEDESGHVGTHYETAYETIVSVDALSEIPHLHDLLMLMFAKGFACGMQHKEAAPTSS